MTKARQSNGELLRLLAMYFIVMHHFVMHSLYRNLKTLDVSGYGWDSHLMFTLHCFIFIGVNCFVLLSGWYSIRLKPRSVINLWAICFFYALLCFVEQIIGAHLYERGSVGFLNGLSSVLLPFSHTDRWFIKCYVALLLLSPILNAVIDSYNQRKWLWVLLLTTVMSVWFGYMWEIPQMNDTGFTTLQFVWLYLIGGYLHRFCSTEWLLRYRRKALWLYIGCSLLWGVLTMLKAYQFRVPFWHPFTYCNPLVMLASIGFFLFVMSFEFKSRWINWLASSTLAVYLVQEGIFRYRWLADASVAWLPAVKVLIVPFLSVGFMAVVLLLDKIRVFIMKPFWSYYDRCIEPRLKKLDFLSHHS